MTRDDALRDLHASITHLSEEDRALVDRAALLAIEAHGDQKRGDGTPFVTHPLAVATILAEWQADTETIVAGLLHDTLEDTTLTLKEIKERFGRSITTLIEGVTKFTQADFEGEVSLDRKIETLRKLLEVMRRDIRVAVIKLADCLHNMRTIEGLPEEKRVRFAREALEIYMKIAYHLGMNEVRRELSELCMPLVEPEASREMLRIREEAMEKGKHIAREMEKSIHSQDIDGSLLSIKVHTRSLSSMHEEKLHTGGIRQGFVLIVLARNRDACYDLLRLFHSLYRPVSAEFHDYIAAPAENAYQTIRTAVIGPENELVLLRIRTLEMQELEHKGVLLKCFREKTEDIPGFSWLKREESLDRSTRESSAAFLEALQSDILQEVISVSVDGNVLSIPRGATVLDAVYAKYGKEANRLKSVVSAGQKSSMSAPVQEDDNLLTTLADAMEVRHEWLEATATTYARTEIVGALKEKAMSEKILLGQKLLQHELDRYRKGLLSSLTHMQQKRLMERYGRGNFNDILALIGEGTLRADEAMISLFPEEHRHGILSPLAPHQRRFRIVVSGVEKRQQDVLAKIHALEQLGSASIVRTRLHFDAETKIFKAIISGSVDSRAHLADFLALLERQEWVSGVQTLFSVWQLASLFSTLLLAFSIIILDIALLPQYQETLRNIPLSLTILLRTLPLLPILGANYFLLRLMRHYAIWMRRDRWFLGAGFLLNFIGLLLVIARGFSGAADGIFPLVAVFIVCMMLLGYHFFQTEALFTHTDSIKLQPLSANEWRTLRMRKLTGYAIRFCAIVIWGIQPLYIKYTPANDIDPLLRVFYTSIGIVLVSSLLMGGQLILQLLRRRGGSLQLHIYRNKELLMIIIGAALFTYFLNASLRLTTSTNFILFNNFSPILALLAAAVFWRQSLAYLRTPRHMLWVFLIFTMGSVGASLILYNSIQTTRGGSLYGDLFGILAMIADTLYVLGQIRYMKKVPDASSLSINLHVFSTLAILLLPVLLFLSFTSPSFLLSMTFLPVMYAIGAGLLSGIGQTLNYEAFRRIDGFIAFLMFNFSILITFITETFALGRVTPTWVLIFGGTIIISSSILAELINSRCEKLGYKE